MMRQYLVKQKHHFKLDSMTKPILILGRLVIEQQSLKTHTEVKRKHVVDVLYNVLTQSIQLALFCLPYFKTVAFYTDSGVIME